MSREASKHNAKGTLLLPARSMDARNGRNDGSPCAGKVVHAPQLEGTLDRHLALAEAGEVGKHGFLKVTR